MYVCVCVCVYVYIFCERDEAVAWLLCAKVEEFTADLPLAHRAMKGLEGARMQVDKVLMARVVPGELKWLFATVRAASSRGPVKAKLSLEDMIQIGEDGYARRNRRLTSIMQLPPGDRRKATYAFLAAIRHSARRLTRSEPATVKTFRWPPGRSSGGLVASAAACVTGVKVVHYAW